MKPVKDLHWLDAGLEGSIASAVESMMPAAETSYGLEVEAFEMAFAATHGVRFAIAVASHADAVELALRAARVGPGDEVITTAFAPAATIRGIENSGASVVFADVDPFTCTLCPHAVNATATERTKAILPVHLFGHPADMTPLLRMAQRHALKVIEDCSEAAGTLDHGRRVGSFGDLGVFGFDASEPATCGTGSVIITDDPQHAARLWQWRLGRQVDHPHDEEDEEKLVAPLSPRQAALLSIRLGRLEKQVALRRCLADLYGRTLGGVLIPAERNGVRHVYHRYAVRAVDRTALRAALTAAGVETTVPTLPSGCAGLPNTQRLAAELLFLPLNLTMTEADVRRVVRAVHETLDPRTTFKKAA